MANDNSDKKVEKENDGALKPDSETLHTTDPQEHMEGPISSLMQKAEKGFEKAANSETTADKKENKE